MAYCHSSDATHPIANVASRASREHDHVGLDDIDAARRALDAAVIDVEVARQAVRDSQDAVRARRAELHAAIVEALQAGARVNAVAGAAGLTREQIRRVARAGGVEAE